MIVRLSLTHGSSEENEQNSQHVKVTRSLLDIKEGGRQRTSRLVHDTSKDHVRLAVHAIVCARVSLSVCLFGTRLTCCG